jgi:transcriptional regulator with XRE-family HTH domain
VNNSRIEQRRREQGISRKEIYAKLGICAKTYYCYINGKCIPSDKLIKLANVLNCSTDYLLERKDYTHITVTDHTGAVLADISQDKIVEHENVKVILS